MNCTIQNIDFFSIFAVPDQVVDKLLPRLDEQSLKVLLCIYRLGKTTIDTEEIAHLAGVSDAAVRGALTKLEKLELIRTGERPAQSTAGPEAEVQPRVRTVSKNTIPKLTDRQFRELVSANGEVQMLVEQAQMLLGRQMNTYEASNLVSLMKWLDLPLDVMLFIIQDSVLEGKNSMRAIKNEAVKWADAGITTHEKAEKYIKERDALRAASRKLESIWGSTHHFSERDLAIATTWLQEKAYAEELIAEAYERCVANTGKLSMPYMDKILASWEKKGLKNLREVLKSDPAKNAKTAEKVEEADASYNISEMEEYFLHHTPIYEKEGQ